MNTQRPGLEKTWMLIFRFPPAAPISPFALKQIPATKKEVAPSSVLYNTGFNYPYSVALSSFSQLS